MADEPDPIVLDDDLGPAMRSLNERRRRFVVAYIDFPKAKGWQLCRMAGYDHKTNLSMRVSAHRLLHSESILRAIGEELDKRFRGRGGAIGQTVMMRIALMDGHKDQYKAARDLAELAGFHSVSEQRMTIEKTDRTGAAMIERIKVLALELGVDPSKLLGGVPAPMKLIEGEAVEVEK